MTDYKYSTYINIQIGRGWTVDKKFDEDTLRRYIENKLFESDYVEDIIQEWLKEKGIECDYEEMYPNLDVDVGEVHDPSEDEDEKIQANA